MKLYLLITYLYGDATITRKISHIDMTNNPSTIGPMAQQIIDKLYSAKDADKLRYVSVIAGSTKASKLLMTGKIHVLQISDDSRAKHLQRDGFIVVKNLPKELRPYKAHFENLVAEVVADTVIDESTNYDFRADMVSNIAAEYIDKFDDADDVLSIAAEYIDKFDDDDDVLSIAVDYIDKFDDDDDVLSIAVDYIIDNFIA